ncbi:hypothetical protein [Sanyastnella coralliicola]|uniref:hypothetical protein n=1 Tax=Sanyastnella coralliicola TaxID=3069118 RepID=UPI0027B99697|nr:hypothetical protein [Longitalea sp. SCSIO 12813]
MPLDNCDARDRLELLNKMAISYFSSEGFTEQSREERNEEVTDFFMIQGKVLDELYEEEATS